jgi:hypothetical protein
MGSCTSSSAGVDSWQQQEVGQCSQHEGLGSSSAAALGAWRFSSSSAGVNSWQQQDGDCCQLEGAAAAGTCNATPSGTWLVSSSSADINSWWLQLWRSSCRKPQRGRHRRRPGQSTAEQRRCPVAAGSKCKGSGAPTQQAFDSRCRKPQCGSHRRVASVSSPNTQSRRAAPVGVVVVPGVMEQLQEAAVRWPWAHGEWQLWMVAVAFGRQSLQQHRRLATCDSSCAGSSSLAGLVMPGPLWQKHLCQCFAQPALS